MSETGSSGAAHLQFDQAQFSDSQAAGLKCTMCECTLTRTYYQVNGQVACGLCYAKAQAVANVKPGFIGLLKAVAAGTAAAAVGALLYYAVLAITGYEIGLVAIVVGFLVGAAVRWGSSNRGGWIYQTLAVALTYLAIVSTYVPFIITGIGEGEQTAVAAQASNPSGDTSSSAGAPGDYAIPVAVTSTAVVAQVPLTGRQLLEGLAMFGLIVIASPFLAGFENIVGWIIIGFAVWQAWTMNRRVVVQIEGPFSVRPPVPRSS